MFNWIDNLWHSVTGRIDSTIADWVHSLVRGLYSFLAAIFTPVAAAWDAFWKDIDGYITAGRLFADRMIAAIKGAYDWINNEGYQVYYYISNPSKLVALLWDAGIAYLETTAEDTAEKLGKFVLTLIVKNVKLIVTIVEDIVDAVF